MPTLGPSILFGLLVLVVILLFALSLGRTRVLVSLLAVYVAFTLQTIFPFFGQLQKSFSSSRDLASLRVIIFLVLYVIIFGLLNRSILRARFNLSEAAFFSVVLMGIIQLGFLVSIILNLAPTFYGVDQYLPKSIMPYIANQHALFYWSLVPLILVLFSKHSHSN